MKRQLAWVLATGVLSLGMSGAALAQDMAGRWAPRFELGVYGGGAYTSEWYQSRFATSTRGVLAEEEDGEGYGFGITPAFGGAATLYASPMFGFRLHYGYLPSALPQADDADATTGRGEDDWILNNHIYDLSLIFRPFAAREGGLLAATYLFLGGGGFTADLASEGPGDDANDGVVCEPFTLSNGACLPLEPGAATVGQGTAGIGFDLFGLSRSLGIFAELAAHVYDSPVHVGSPFVPPITVSPGQRFAVADDMYGVTGRAVLGLKIGFGGFQEMMTAPPVPVPTAPPVAAPRPAPAPAPTPPPPATRDVTVCVVTGTGLQSVTATLDPATGDTTVMGQRFSTRYPTTAPTYAGGTTWFVNSDQIRLGDTEFVKFGVPRLITSTGQLQRVGDHQGTSVFAETGATAPYQVLYVPLRPGCEFQPYSPRPRVRG